jgi:purine nucleosidase
VVSYLKSLEITFNYLMKKALIILFLVIGQFGFAQKQKVWLDADTGNEMDDVWAIVRLLWAKDQVDIVGLSSAHFNNADMLVFKKYNQYNTKNINTVKISQKLNEVILKTMGLTNIAHPSGADRQMGRAWGQSDPRSSDATDLLLKTIKGLGPNEKLDIIQIGAATNIASLIALDSTVKSKIRLLSLAFWYNEQTGAWNKNDFNTRCDLNAQDFLLNQVNLDWTIITATTCFPFTFQRDSIYANMSETQKTEQLMKKRWRETYPLVEKRVLWDLAVIEAYLKPEHTVIKQVLTPPENHQHLIKMITKIDTPSLQNDFWDTLLKNRKNEW